MWKLNVATMSWFAGWQRNFRYISSFQNSEDDGASRMLEMFFVLPSSPAQKTLGEERES